MKKLPKIDVPLYELTLPSTQETIRYRPFTVKEEKILLVAKETNDVSQAMLAVKQVINNCIVGKNVEELAMFDLEYLLISLRSKSINNVINFSVKDPETNETVNLEVNLDEVKMITNSDHTNRISVNKDYVLFLKYPTIDQFTEILQSPKNDPMVNYKIMLSCLDKVASETEVYKFSDFSPKEIDEFIDELQSDIIIKIKDFFETMPKTRHEIKYKNGLGNEKTFVIEGMQSFFI